MALDLEAYESYLTQARLDLGVTVFNPSAHPRGAAGSGSGGRFVASGQSGTQVQAVQQRLNRSTPGKKLKVDGQFGTDTHGAVVAFQKAHGLKVDGIVGAQTAAALLGQQATKPGALTPQQAQILFGQRAASAIGRAAAKASRQTPSQSRSSRQTKATAGAAGRTPKAGASTKPRSTKTKTGAKGTGPQGTTNVQQALQQAGINAPAAGGGPGGDFNTKHPRIAQGQPQAGEFIAKGSTGAGVTAVQSKLGISQTGTYDANTQKAVRAYQQKHGLQVDGVVGSQTASSMLGGGKSGVGGLTAQQAGALGGSRGKKHLSEATVSPSWDSDIYRLHLARERQRQTATGLR